MPTKPGLPQPPVSSPFTVASGAREYLCVFERTELMGSSGKRSEREMSFKAGAEPVFSFLVNTVGGGGKMSSKPYSTLSCPKST